MAAALITRRALSLALASLLWASGNEISEHGSLEHKGLPKLELFEPAAVRTPAETDEHHQADSLHGHAGSFDQYMNVSSVILLFTFMAMTTSFLFLAFYLDEDIRWTFYNLLSNTIAIFLSIMVNTTIFTFFTKQVVEGVPPRGFGLPVNPWIHMFVRFLMFFGAAIALNVCCSRCVTRTTMFMFSSMGEHLLAFSGIGAFYKVQELINTHMDLGQYKVGLLMLLVPVCARLTCIVLFRLMICLRKRLLSSFSKTASHLIARHCKEAENQGSVTLVSFLFIQGIVSFFTGEFMPLTLCHHHEGGFDYDEAGWPVASQILLIGCVMVAAHCLVGCLRHYTNVSEENRNMNNFLAVPGMSISWCFLRASIILARTYFPEHRVAALVVNAALMYGLAMLVVVILDRMADQAASRDEEKKLSLRSGSAGQLTLASGPDRFNLARTGDFDPESESDSSVTGAALSGSLIPSSATGMSRRPPTPLSPTRLLEQISPAVDRERLMKAHEDFDHHFASNARSTIRYLALLVGLCWEKAWDEADEFLLECPVVKDHPVLAQWALATLMIVWTGAAWYHYIVRMAILTLEEHKARIASEKAEMDNFAFEKDAVNKDVLDKGEDSGSQSESSSE